MSGDTMQVTRTPEPGESASRTAERAFVEALDARQNYSADLRKAGAHGGDGLVWEPTNRLTLVEVRMRDASAEEPAPAPVFEIEPGLRQHRATMSRLGADRIVVVYADVDTDNWVFSFRAMGAERFEALARRASRTYLAAGGPRGRKRPPRYPVMFEEMDPLSDWFEEVK